MATEGTYTRRVCAVLLADVSEFSTLMGEDDERTARAVQRLHSVIQGIVAETNGQAEPVAGDAIFATFESVVAAVDAALHIQRRIASEDFAGRPLRVRIGVHFGDLLLREGAAFGDAINVAARLQTLARPGTICISGGVYRHVRNKFDETFEDLGRQRLKNISDPVHAYLIVPRGTGVSEVRGSSLIARRLRWAGALVVLGVLAAVAVQLYRSALPKPMSAGEGTVADEARRVALGVMLFKPLGESGGNAWMREALRDGLNTQLSELSNVKVYSKEFIDFLITRQGLTEIEAANRLGIKKMLSGSFIAVGGTLRIETHVVDVASGVLESSYTTVGREQDFPELQNRMVLGIVSRLNLPITADERQALLSRKSTDLDALRLLLEAEGGAVPEAPPATPRGPDSAVPRWLALLRPDTRTAQAADGVEPKAEILAVLERYRRASEAREVQAIAAVYVDFSAEQQAAQQRYFDNVRDLRVGIENVDIAVVGDEAVVSYTRIDDFADARTGRPMHVALRLTKVLRRQAGEWKMAGSR